ncbi:hypothetical protein [Tsukamurella sp. PLM1]|uniref:hypothetical protein n=1 Tax=Tsukamurella sp. PLM1 TaxID=2929795 RepID=UPI00205690A3|nr:hypothetical protein [Tsukamurella sp. PLM1]BDH57671.1 hypothetical protein MTP03_26100 [Tsukamurella sp. PLM1]
MQRWISDNPYQAGMLAGLMVFLPVTLLLAWFLGRDKRFGFRPLDIVIGFGCVYPVALVLAWTVQYSEFASGFALFAGFTLAYVLALSVAKVRSTRAIRRDETARTAARAAIPAPAREYFGREGFARVLDGVGSSPRPTSRRT